MPWHVCIFWAGFQLDRINREPEMGVPVTRECQYACIFYLKTSRNILFLTPTPGSSSWMGIYMSDSLTVLQCSYLPTQWWSLVEWITMPTFPRLFSWQPSLFSTEVLVSPLYYFCFCMLFHCCMPVLVSTGNKTKTKALGSCKRNSLRVRNWLWIKGQFPCFLHSAM